jgi:hypothetical protein
LLIVRSAGDFSSVGVGVLRMNTLTNTLTNWRENARAKTKCLGPFENDLVVNFVKGAFNFAFHDHRSRETRTAESDCVNIIGKGEKALLEEKLHRSRNSRVG